MKIPPHAKLVFQGHIFDVYQWQQEMFDGTFETFEMLRRPDIVKVIATSPQTIYLTEEEQSGQSGSFLSVPGGRMEPGEDPLIAAKRELLEETGLQAEEWELWITRQPSGKIDCSIYTYIARGCKKVADQHLDAGERITLKTVTFEQFLDIMLKDSFREKELAFEILKLSRNPEEMQAFRKMLGV